MVGESVIHLQAADFWGNNLTHGGDMFVARFTERLGDERTLEERTMAREEIDTGATASAFPSRVGGDPAPSDVFDSTVNQASVVDQGTGKYEVTTIAVSGKRWLELGMAEPGGLWGTYYRDGCDDAAGERREYSRPRPCEALDSPPIFSKPGLRASRAGF